MYESVNFYHMMIKLHSHLQTDVEAKGDVVLAGFESLSCVAVVERCR